MSERRDTSIAIAQQEKQQERHRKYEGLSHLIRAEFVASSSIVCAVDRQLSSALSNLLLLPPPPPPVRRDLPCGCCSFVTAKA